MPKGFAPLYLLLGIALLVGVILLVPIGINKLTSTFFVPKTYNGVIVSSPEPLASPIDEISNWKTYTNNNLDAAFKYPSDWHEPQTSPETGIKLEDSIYVMTFSSRPNHNDQTNLPFNNLDEYLNQNTGKRHLVVAGQDAIQILPRAGSENIYNAVFFSPNRKYIFSVELQTLVNDPAKAAEGQQLFNQILSTFTFLNQTPEVTKFSDDNITEAGNGQTFSYPFDERFSFNLDPKKHPLKNLNTANCPFGYVSNLSVNGPEVYPIGFQTMTEGSCVVKDGDFSVTIKVIQSPN